jgi:vanillate O-demethylase monooxygenase subunit
MDRPPKNLPKNCTLSREDWNVLAACWHPIAYGDAITDQPQSLKLLDEELVVYRTAKGVVVAKDLCIHRGARLSLGWLEGDELVCAYHGFRYGFEGKCTGVPAHPTLPISEKLCLITFPTIEKYGLIWTCLSATPLADLAVWPELEDPTYHRIHLDPFDWRASAARQAENFLDITHFSWLHVGTFGNREKPEIEKYEVTQTGTGLHMDYVYPMITPFGESMQTFSYDVTLPFSSRIQLPDFNRGRKYAIFVSACPISARLTRIFFFMAQDGPFEDIEGLIAFETKVFAEDQRLVESQHPEELPLDLSAEFHIRADQMSTAYRKALVKLGLGGEYSS